MQLASFPGLPTVQFLIAYSSMQKRSCKRSKPRQWEGLGTRLGYNLAIIIIVILETIILCPLQNFLALCASGYYNDCLFHRYCMHVPVPTTVHSSFHDLLPFHSRNIKDFMVQTGDPTGTGKGGTSIWGRKFEDEFHETLKVY